MRKNTVVSVTLAIAVLIALTATGQQAVIDLPVEPQRAATALTLADAAATNNYPAFMALYRDAADARLYRDLHELWQYSMTDPIGAFYGIDMYERFARRYPGYSTFIADHAVIDSRGDTYYPSAETRTFLLAQVGTATVVPEEKPQVADGARVSEPASPVVAIPAAPAAESAALHTAAFHTVTPVVAVAVAPSAPAVAPAVAPAPAPIRVASRVAPVSRPDATRGIFLTILGLAGIGMLSLMLQTPSSEDEQADHAA